MSVLFFAFIYISIVSICSLNAPIVTDITCFLSVSIVLAITGRPLMKFESGYNVETVFDGSKLGIEPHALEVLPNGELLVLDSANSNLYKISSSLSLCK